MTVAFLDGGHHWYGVRALVFLLITHRSKEHRCHKSYVAQPMLDNMDIAIVIACLLVSNGNTNIGKAEFPALRIMSRTCRLWRKAIDILRRRVLHSLMSYVHQLPFTRGPYNHHLITGLDRRAVVKLARTMYARILAHTSDCNAMRAILFCGCAADLRSTDACIRYSQIGRTELFPAHIDETDATNNNSSRIVNWCRQVGQLHHCCC
jgi:hypothetical protein